MDLCIGMLLPANNIKSVSNCKFTDTKTHNSDIRSWVEELNTKN